MARINLRALAAALLVLVAVPALAQMGFSEGFRFMKAVRERDSTVLDEITSNPSSNAVNYRDPSTGEGAVHMLTRGRDITWLSILLARGARPDLPSSDGTTALMLAAQIGWREGAERLLVRGANVNQANNRGETPLIFAVQRNDISMVRMLTAQGGDPNQTDSMAGYSAIDYARQDRRRSAILQVLESATPRSGASPRP